MLAYVGPTVAQLGAYVGPSVYNLRLPPKALRAAHGPVAGARILELTLIVGFAGLLDLRCHRRVGLKAIE